MKILREFKEFAARGSVIDLAVGVIIGGAFGKIVTSLVNDVVMPPIGLLLGRVDFKNLFVALSAERFDTLADAKAAGAVTINYGAFLNTIIEFLIVAAVIFLIVRQINRLKAAGQPAKVVDTKACPHCLTTVPRAATKCMACTSELGTDEKNDA